MPIIAIESDEHWHQLRKTHIGASEIAALFGVKAFTTPHEIWCRMKGLHSATYTHDFLEFGQDMEPIIAKYLARTYGLEVVKAREYHIHPDYPWLGCTPDYYIANSEHGKAGLQIKHASGSWVEGWTQDKAPDYVEFQVQQELFIQQATLKEYGYAPIDRHYIGVMMGGNVEDMRLMERRLRPDIAREIVEVSRDFMTCVKNGEPPITSDKDIHHIAEMFKQAEIHNEVLDLRMVGDKVDADVAGWLAAQAEEIAARRRKDAIKARLMRACLVFDQEDVLGHTLGETDNFEISMKLGEVHYKEREASVTEQLRFNVRKKWK